MHNAQPCATTEPVPHHYCLCLGGSEPQTPFLPAPAKPYSALLGLAGFPQGLIPRDIVADELHRVPW